MPHSWLINKAPLNRCSTWPSHIVHSSRDMNLTAGHICWEHTIINSIEPAFIHANVVFFHQIKTLIAITSTVSLSHWLSLILHSEIVSLGFHCCIVGFYTFSVSFCACKLKGAVSVTLTMFWDYVFSIFFHFFYVNNLCIYRVYKVIECVVIFFQK